MPETDFLGISESTSVHEREHDSFSIHLSPVFRPFFFFSCSLVRIRATPPGFERVLFELWVTRSPRMTVTGSGGIERGGGGLAAFNPLPRTECSAGPGAMPFCLSDQRLSINRLLWSLGNWGYCAIVLCCLWLVCVCVWRSVQCMTII